MDEDYAFSIGFQWEEVEGFLKDPRGFVEAYQADQDLDPETAAAIALPPPPRAATFICRYDLSEKRAVVSGAPVIVEGTKFADVMVVRVRPDNSEIPIDLAYENEGLEITIRPKDHIGFAHLAIPGEKTGQFASQLLRSPVHVLNLLNDLLEKKGTVTVVPGTEDSDTDLNPRVRLRMPDSRSFETAMFVYQTPCPNNTVVCYKNGGLLVPNPDEGGYFLEMSTVMIVCYYPPA
jgi:hypothetical protein